MNLKRLCILKILVYFSILNITLTITANMFNKEIDSIELGRSDYKSLSTQPLKSLVCITFIKADYRSLKILHNNMNLMRGYCDWIVIFYNDNDELIEEFCNLISIDSIDHIDSNAIVSSIDMVSKSKSIPIQIALCKKTSLSSKQPFIKVPLLSGGMIRQRKSIPKSVLYQEIVDIIPTYDMTFIMDEDISLEGFSITRFIKKWKCSFGLYRPLIVQPLIAEDTQYFPYLYEKFWKKSRTYSKYAAATVGLVEQQVPFFNTTFLVWYIRHVLSHTKDVALKYGVDQSIDKTWCRAAEMYAREVLNYNLTENNTMCGIIIAAPPVHHKNFHSLVNKRANRKNYVKLGLKVNDVYKTQFPSWVLEDIISSINPLDPVHRSKYKVIKSSSEVCMRRLDSYMFQNNTLHLERYNMLI